MPKAPPAPATWWRAAIVGVAVLAALTLIKLAVPAIGRPTPFLTYFVAILLASWQGGLMVGLVITAVSAACGYGLFIVGEPGVTWTSSATQVAAFGLEGAVISWLAARARDDRRLAQTATDGARDAVDQLEGVLNALDEGVTVQDADGDVVYANAAAARVVGLPNPGDLMGTPVTQLAEHFDVLDGDGQPLSLDRLPNRMLLAGQQPEDLLVEFRVRNGSERRFSQVAARAIRDEQGALRFVVSTFRDVTEVEQARADAVLANRAKDDFLAMLGHELRNPLAPILTALELMKLQPEVGIERAREVIERQVRAMVRLIDDLLDVSRIAHGRIELSPERVELTELVSKGLEVATPSIEQRRHRVEVSVEPGLYVQVDPLRMVQVIANLLTNAAKYTEPGGRIVIRGEAEDDEAVLRVRDSGVGIAPEMLPRIFDVFVQQPQALDRAQGGLGLGLTIVKSLVELHGGRVSAHSEGLGRGSELVVRLPADLAATEPTARVPTGPLRPTDAAVRVLLVDDNADALEMLAELLATLGYVPYTAADGEAALELAPQVHPDVALLDIGLPVIDGYELGRRLRTMPGLEDLVLVALTGYGQPSDRARSTAAGFAAHLVKPVAISEIRRVLEELTRGPGSDEG